MDYLKNMTGSGSNQDTTGTNQQTSQTTTQNEQGSSGGGFLGGLGNKLNSAAGGGPESEKNEDMLDKAYDMYQEKVLGQGPQNNESALEQRQDEMATDFIRQGAKRMTGGDYLPKDK